MRRSLDLSPPPRPAPQSLHVFQSGLRQLSDQRRSTKPTQVVQIFKDQADNVNVKMKAMLVAYGAGPWQNYKLINVQWPQNPVLLSNVTVPAMVPLPSGNLNTQTLTNPVLETFQQQQNTGCMACHV